METRNNFNESVPQEQIDVDKNIDTTVSPEIPTSDDETLSDIEVKETALTEEILLDSDAERIPNEEENDYSQRTSEELLKDFAALVNNNPVNSIRKNVDAVKTAFYKEYKKKIELLKAEFIENGGIEEEFEVPADEEEERFKILLSEYRKKRDEFIADSEKEKEENYKEKLRIIDQLKELVNSNETLNHTFATFRDLQNRWKEIGPIPQVHVKDLWETYHLHVENFYNYIKINNELRDLDLKKNAESKTQLCEDAEALLLEGSPITAFHKLQKLHEQWREIGPVSKELKEPHWDRFKEASSKINKRHQEHFENLKEEQLRNLEMKTELCLKAEEIANSEYSGKKEIDKASDSIIEIQKIWKTIGFAPKKENTVIYERFRIACDTFFEKKRVFYSSLKDEMEKNLNEKMEICLIAESLQESTDWKNTTDQLIALQKRWKDTGMVSRKYSDSVWKRFRKACDTFFDRKAAHYSEIDLVYGENLLKKRQLLEEIKKFEITDRDHGFETLKDYQRRWAEIGFVPLKEKDALQGEYREVIDAHFAKLKGEDKDRKIERFRDKISSFKNKNSVRSERDRLYNKMKQLEADISLLENNIGFFAKSKNAESLIRDVNDKISKAKEEMAVIAEKIKLIDNQEG
ncbi:MAG: DUF349 domain-containing protein [Rikenellaceae bacterium]|nr:DUF349 domain-containing protein [Rikenellaceae bacterium]